MTFSALLAAKFFSEGAIISSSRKRPESSKMTPLGPLLSFGVIVMLTPPLGPLLLSFEVVVLDLLHGLRFVCS